MQSWGTESSFETRRSDPMPSKSGVIGLLAAALGWRRDADLSRLNDLRFGTRADLPGKITYDFQMARLKKTENDTVSYLTYRYYIEDGIYLAGLETDDRVWLETLGNALTHPVFHLYLGRRSYAPTQPVYLGIRDKNLEEALRTEEWLVPLWRRKQTNPHIVLQLEADELHIDQATARRDTPISFDSRNRRFTERMVYETRVDFGTVSDTEHDIFSVLEQSEEESR